MKAKNAKYSKKDQDDSQNDLSNASNEEDNIVETEPKNDESDEESNFILFM